MSALIVDGLSKMMAQSSERIRFDAIAFDFDGVLVESVDIKTQAFAELYRPYGEEIVSQVIDYHLKHGGISRHEKFHYFHETLLGIPLPPSEIRQLAENFSRLVVKAIVNAPWVDGAENFLIAWHAHIPLFVASGTPEKELKNILTQRGMMHYFKGVYGTPCAKDKILLGIAQQQNIKPARILMVGDSITDYEGAQIAGTGFLGYVSSASPFPSTTHVCSDYIQFEEYLNESCAN